MRPYTVTVTVEVERQFDALTAAAAALLAPEAAIRVLKGEIRVRPTRRAVPAASPEEPAGPGADA